MGELRRQLSVVNLRANMVCLLDRLEQAGEGGRMATRRQEAILREEERMREEREMMWKSPPATWPNYLLNYTHSCNKVVNCHVNCISDKINVFVRGEPSQPSPRSTRDLVGLETVSPER